MKGTSLTWFHVYILFQALKCRKQHFALMKLINKIGFLSHFDILSLFPVHGVTFTNLVFLINKYFLHCEICYMS